MYSTRLTEVGGIPGAGTDTGLCKEPRPPKEGAPLVGRELVVEVGAGSPGKLDVIESRIEKWWVRFGLWTAKIARSNSCYLLDTHFSHQFPLITFFNQQKHGGTLDHCYVICITYIAHSNRLTVTRNSPPLSGWSIGLAGPRTQVQYLRDTTKQT